MTLAFPESYRMKLSLTPRERTNARVALDYAVAGQLPAAGILA